MLGLLYLLWIFIIGYYLMLKFTPWFDYATLGSPETDKPRVPAWMMQLPFAWILGALVVNWINFFLCNFNRSISATLFTMTAAGTAAVWIVLSERKNPNSVFFANLRRLWQGTGKTEWCYLLIALALACYTNLYTLADNGKELFISSGVFSDFAPHTSLIRSFSVGENFPPQYPHFAAGDIPYHFLFHFLVASLESLGLPLSWSFNIPSILSVTSLLLLIYVLALRITGWKAVAFWAMFFIFFRSSWAFFDLARNYSLTQLPEAILDTNFYVGKTANAGWGMWTLFNTFANQRHLAFGICAALIAIILMLPQVETKISSTKEENRLYAWRMGNTQRAIFIGLFLGAIAFWNGATLIAGLLVLAGFALNSRHRMEYILIAVIAVILASLQARWFISAGKTPVSARFVFGFLAEQRTLAGAASYIFQAFGLLIPLFIASLFYWRKHAAIGLAFAMPFIFAFTVQPTIEMALNHKFILVSEFLMGIFVAWMLIDIWRNKAKVWRVVLIPIFVLLTITGTVDTAAFHNINNIAAGKRFGVPKDNPVTAWVMKNTPPRSIFLTELVTLNPVLYAGRLSYLGWPYYGWGAGYDTTGREQDIRLIYGAGTKEDLEKALQNKPIDYILVNDPVRNSTNYVINETLIADTFPLVFDSPYEGTKIYQVRKNP
jgi:hypothetical protein